DLLAARIPHLEMQVDAGREAAAAHGGDLLACPDTPALAYRDRVDVTVDGDRAVIVQDAYPQAESARRTRLDDRAVSDRADRCSLRVGDVDPVVRGSPPAAE